MDHVNLFETRTTYNLTRLEYGVGLAAASGLFVLHLDDIHWMQAVILFAYIDLVGYVPGAIAFRRSTDGRISKIYYILYNVMHSLVTQSIVVALWSWLIKPEWALLAIPIHLFGDRALFGNTLKPFSVPFEPGHISATAQRRVVPC